MEKRRIGRSELMVAPLVFGGNVFGWTIDEKKAFEILDAFVGAGFNMIDTADVYPRWATGVGGESEVMIGNWMKARHNRKQIILATKVGMDMGEGRSGLSKKYILNAVEGSLKRLQAEYIDLYQSHKDDESTPVEETLEAYAQLVKKGKVRYIGASNFSPERLSASLRASEKNNFPRYECVQPHYNLCERKIFENGTEQVCMENKLGVISYYSLASGFLTGKYRSHNDTSKSVRGKGVSKYLNEKGFTVLDALDKVAGKHKVSPASVALAWLMMRPSVTAPVASATSLFQLSELIRSADLKLDPEDQALLDKASDWQSSPA